MQPENDFEREIWEDVYLAPFETDESRESLHVLRAPAGRAAPPEIARPATLYDLTRFFARFVDVLAMILIMVMLAFVFGLFA